MSKSALHDAVNTAHDLAPSTRAKYARDLDAWIEFAGSDPNAWTKKRALDFQKSMVDRGLAEDSANRVMISIRYASRRRALNAADDSLDFLGEGDQFPHALTQEEVTKLLATCTTGSGADLRDRAIIITGLETGLRKTALASMTIEHLWLRAETPAAAVIMRGSDHTDERITIPISDAVVHLVKPWLHFLSSMGATRGPLFRGLIRRRGGFRPANPSLSTSMLQKIVMTRGQKAGLDNVSPETLRQTYVEWRSRAGLTPKEYLPEQLPGQKAREATPQWLKILIGVK